MNKNFPLISVIVPIYNSEKFLEKCVDSLINQTYKNVEILLVNDGSTDSSATICDAFAKKDNRVTVIHKKNGGQAEARNMALDIAKGDYIGFVDSDDTIAPNMFEKLYSAIEEYGCEISMCGRYNVDEETNEMDPFFWSENIRQWDTDEVLRRFLTWDDIDGALWDKLFSKRVIENIRFPLGFICEDIPFVYEALKNTKKLVHIGTPLYYYLQRQGSTSRSKITKKTFGLVKYPEQIRRDIISTHPTLSKCADYFYISREILYIQQLFFEKHDATGKERTKILRKQNHILFNSLFSFRQKLYYYLMRTYLFLPIYRCYKFLKGKKR